MLPKKSQEEQIIHLLSALERQVFRISMRQSREGALAIQQLLVLDYLKGGKACRLHEMGVELGFAQATATELTHRMMRAGLITRQRDPKDQRALLVGITDNGRKKLEEYQCTARSFYEEILSDEPAKGQGMLSALETLLAQLLPSSKESEV